MNERIKKLRKALDLTQQEFAARIGSVQNTITGYETGRREPSNQVIALICREFSVSEEWLRTGTGEMFVPAAKDTLGELCAELNATELEEQIMRAYFRIDAKIREPFMRQLLQEVQATVSTTNANQEKPAPAVQAWVPVDTGGQEQTDEDIEREVEDFRRLLLEKKQAGEPSPSSAGGATAYLWRKKISPVGHEPRRA